MQIVIRYDKYFTIPLIQYLVKYTFSMILVLLTTL